ncbi:MAG: hypothetical protein AAGJ35_14330, partial [Myxococcota bacterium]
HFGLKRILGGNWECLSRARFMKVARCVLVFTHTPWQGSPLRAPIASLRLLALSGYRTHFRATWETSLSQTHRLEGVPAP